MKQTLKRILSGLGLLLIVLLLIGFVKQSSYNASVEKNYPATGSFADIGYNKIHYKYDGSGAVTYVLIAGLGESMQTWESLAVPLKERGRVFRYDRSGLGHSEVGAMPRSVEVMATELKAVLDVEQIPGPYIFIGHSAGGFLARYYAKKYPEDILGLYLIDPYQETGREETESWPLSYRLHNWSLRNLSWSSIPYYSLPQPPHPIYKTAKCIRTYGLEAYSEEQSLDEFANLDHGQSTLPIYLISAQKQDNPYAAMNLRWHKMIMEKYKNPINKHLIVQSGHHVHIENPQYVLDYLDEFHNALANTSK
ncbi:alpha/beta fold hydrolase [Gilvibacter sp.]|uniref:alpha/beta fold hydrolase n=1 Tax=Gilvibacter sp. TaxID=2729997 RepID=UPI003F49DF13